MMKLEDDMAVFDDNSPLDVQLEAVRDAIEKIKAVPEDVRKEHRENLRDLLQEQAEIIEREKQ